MVSFSSSFLFVCILCYLNRNFPPNIKAINFVTDNDVRALREIEAYHNIVIEEMPMDVADLF